VGSLLLPFLFGLETRKLRLLLLLESLLNLLAQVFRQFAVTLLADRLAIPRSELPVLEWCVASAAEKVVCMIGFFKEFLAAARNRLLAIGAIVAEELYVVGLAIGKTIVLEKVRLGKGLIADVAAEVIWMPNLAKSSDRSTFTRFAAASTFLQEQDFVVRCAIVIAFELVAVTTLKFNTALFTPEVARMHELSLNKQVRANDRPVAHSALMGVRANDSLFGLHTLRAINVLRLGLDLVLLTDQIRAAADANEMFGVEGKAALSIDNLAANNIVTDLAALSVQLHEILFAVEFLVWAN